MKLLSPFKISARLLPALQIGDVWISHSKEGFVIDGPDWSEKVDDYTPGAFMMLQSQFTDIVGFMIIAGENEGTGYFAENTTEFCTKNIDELQELQCELEENDNLIQED